MVMGVCGLQPSHCFFCLEIKPEMWFKSHFSKWIGCLPGVLLLLSPNMMCLDITQGGRGERWLRRMFGEKLEAAPAAELQWAVFILYGVEPVTEPRGEFYLPFSQQINNFRKTACCYLPGCSALNQALLIPGVGLEGLPTRQRHPHTSPLWPSCLCHTDWPELRASGPSVKSSPLLLLTVHLGWHPHVQQVWYLKQHPRQPVFLLTSIIRTGDIHHQGRMAMYLRSRSLGWMNRICASPKVLTVF